ncbi:hypothetical protein BST61_g6522 [Cercospora zeina]
MAPEHTWSEEQLRVILLLFTQWKLEKNKKLAHQIFKIIFPQWKGNQTALWREVRDRLEEGTSPLWHDIDRPNTERQDPFTAGEINTNFELFEKIKSSVDEETREKLKALESWAAQHYIDGDCWRQATADKLRREREARERKDDSGASVQAGPSNIRAGEKEWDMDEEKEKELLEQSKKDESAKDENMDIDTEKPSKSGKSKKPVKPGSLASAEWQQRHFERRDREEALKDVKAKLQEMGTGRGLRSRPVKVTALKADIAKDFPEEAGEEKESEDDGDGELFVQPAKPTKTTRKYGTSNKGAKHPSKELKDPSKNPFEESSDDEEEEESGGEIEPTLPTSSDVKRRYRSKAFNGPIQFSRETRAGKAANSKDGEDEDEEEEHDDQEQEVAEPRLRTRAAEASAGYSSGHLAAVNQKKSTKAAGSKDEEAAEEERDEIPQTPAKPSAKTQASRRNKAAPPPAAFSPRYTRSERAAQLSANAKEDEAEEENDIPPTPAEPPARQRISRFRLQKSSRVIAPRQTRGRAAMKPPAQPTIEEEESESEGIPPSKEVGKPVEPVGPTSGDEE